MAVGERPGALAGVPASELRLIADRLAAIEDPRVLLQAIFAFAPVAFGVVQADGHTLVVNHAFRELFGSEPPPEYNILKDEIVEKMGLLSLIHRAFAGETVQMAPFWYDPRDLTQVHVEGRRVAIGLTLFPLLDGEGKVRQVAICYRDVTAQETLAGELAERQRTAEALRLSEARYRTQFEHAPEAVVSFDIDAGTFIEANPAAERLFKLSRAELLQRHPASISPPVQPDGRRSEEAAREWIERAFLGEQPVFEWMHIDANGEEIPCEVRLVQLPGEEGRRLCRGTVLDIRERLRLQELRERSAELEEENIRIQEANRLKSEFLANMSHELRTPLNAVLGFAQLLFEGRVEVSSPQHQEFLGHIVSSGQHLLQLINDVLDLAKVEAGKIDFRPEPVVLEQLIDHVVATLRETAVHKAIQVATEIEPDLPEVTIDPARLRQVLYNYLSNALKFTAEGGHVVVRVRREQEDRFRVEVEDDGIGIAAEEHERLFLQFQQLDASLTKRHSGTGLGLALTKRLVEAQGGWVGVRSELGRGSVFWAVLPCQAG